MGRGNQKGGKKHKRGKKEGYETKTLRLKEEDQEYAQITACKGNCRFDVKCFDGKERMAVMCGSMRKRQFVNLRQVVLVSLRDFQDSVCDIIDSYDENGARKLKETKELPESFKLGEDNDFLDDFDGVEFTTEMPSDNSDDDTIEGEKVDDDDIDLDEI